MHLIEYFSFSRSHRNTSKRVERFCSFVLLVVFFNAAADATTVSWSNSAGGSWNTGANWSTGMVPTPTDTVIISLVGTYTVTLDVSPTVAGLTLGGASGSQTLSVTGRTLTLSGSSSVSTSGTLFLQSLSSVVGSGTLTNQGTINLNSSTISCALNNQGTFVASANTSSSSNIGGALTVSSGSTLRVENSTSGYAGNLVVANGFTNNGTMEIRSTGAAATLTVTNGTLINASGREIITSGTTGGSRTLTAAFDNQGTITLPYTLTINKASAAHTNSGTINVSGGDLTLTQSGTSPSFTNTGTISLSAGRILLVSGGTFNQNGGSLGSYGLLSFANITVNMNTTFGADSMFLNTVTGTFTGSLSTAAMGMAFLKGTINTDSVVNVAGKTLTLWGSTLNCPMINRGTLLVSGFNSSSTTSNLNGALTVSSGSTLRVENSTSGYAGNLVVANGFTNNGTIEIKSTGAAATLTVTNGTLINASGREIITSGTTGGSRTLTAAFDNQGTITLPYALTINKASAAHTNSGTINVSGGDLTLTQSGTSPSFTNTGTISLSAGRILLVSGGTFNQNGGSLGSYGLLSFANITVNMNTTFGADSMFLNTVTGTFTGSLSTAAMGMAFLKGTINTDSVVNVAGKTLTLWGSTLNCPMINRGTLLVSGFNSSSTTSNLNGALTVSSGSTLRVENSTSGYAGNLVVANGFTNNGTMEIRSTGAAATLTVTNGTLINASGREIITSGTTGGSRTLTAAFDNQGTITLPYTLTINKASAAHTNSGTINVSGGDLTLTQSGTSPSFTNTGTISLSAGRILLVSGGTFNQNGGSLGSYGLLSFANITVNMNTTFGADSMFLNTVTGTFTGSLSTAAMGMAFLKGTINTDSVVNVAGKTLTLWGSTLNCPMINRGTLLVSGFNSSSTTSNLNGALTVSSGSTLRVENSTSGYAGNLVVANGFTNNGTIEIKSTGAAATLTVTNGTLINASGREIITSGTTGGSRTLTAAFDNQGTITLPYALTINKASAAHTNSGTINVSGGDLTLTQSGTSPSFTNTGTISVGSGRVFTVTGGTLTNSTGGILFGSGTLAVSSTAFSNSGSINPGNSIGILTVNGSITQTSNGSLNVEIGGINPGVDYDRVNLSANAALTGALNLSVVNGFVPSLGQVYRIFKYGSHTGVFATVTGTQLPGGLILQPLYQDTSLAISVTSEPLCDPPILAVPSNGANGIEVPTLLSWYRPQYASSYRLQIATDSLFAGIVQDRVGLSDTVLSVDSLVLHRLYYWRVNASNSAGTSGWSNIWTFTIRPMVVQLFPYSEGFEALASGWSTWIASGSANDWVIGTPAKQYINGAHSGTKAYVTKVTGNYTMGVNAFVLSPVFDFTSVDYPAVEFWHNFRTFDGYDYAVLEYSTNGGTSWLRVDSVQGTGGDYGTQNSLNWYNRTESGPSWAYDSYAYPGHASGWIKSTTKVYGVGGQASVVFRWRLFDNNTYWYGETTSQGWAIDDITVKSLPPLNGTYAVGNAQSAPFNSLTNAIAWLKYLGVSGPVTFSLVDTLYNSSETFPISIVPFAGANAANTLTIKPASGVDTQISGSSATSIFLLNLADFVIIDGSNSPTGTGRNLTIINNSTSANTAAIWLSGGGATNNIIKNCNIVCGADQSTSSNATFGIISCGGAISTQTVGVDNDSNSYSNNYVTKCRYGIFSEGQSSGNPNGYTTVVANIIGPNAFGADEIGVGGIIIYNETNATVSGNEVRFVGGTFGQGAAGSSRIGIGFTLDALWPPQSLAYITNSSIVGNTVHDIIDEKTFSAAGIVLSEYNGTSNVSNIVANNFVYNIRSNGISSGVDNYQAVGIGIAGGYGDVIAFNTVYMTGDIDPAGTASATVPSAGIYIASRSATDILVRNNISYMDISSNTSSLLHTAFSYTASHIWGTGGSNYNDYYASPSNPQARIASFPSVFGNFYQTLAEWRAVTHQDSTSISQDPAFFSSNNLHIISSVVTQIDSGGIPVTGITTDIDGDNRNSERPDIGADEFTRTELVVSEFPFSQDFETNSQGWSTGTIGPSSNPWVLGTPAKNQISSAHSGTRAFVTGTTVSYTNNLNVYILSPTFNFLSLSTDPVLEFWHNFKTEDGYDAGILEGSTDGGATWRRIDSTLGVGSTFNTTKSLNWYNGSYSSGAFPSPNWSGTSTVYSGHSSGWIRSSTKLTGMAGISNVKFRWRFGTDESSVDEGWAIDDVSVLPSQKDIQVVSVALSTSPQPFAVNRSMTVSTKIKNKGTESNPASLSVTYKPNGIPATLNDGVSQTFTPTWSGDSATVTFTTPYTPASVGLLTVGVRAFYGDDLSGVNDSLRSEAVMVYEEGALEEIVYRAGLDKSIPDNLSGTLYDTLDYPFVEYMSNLVVRDVQVMIDTLLHSYVADVVMSIIHNGDSLDLSIANGGSGQNYVETVFDDLSTMSIEDGTAPFTGHFRSEGTPGLSRYYSRIASGIWILKLQDIEAEDVGTLHQWGIRVIGVPPPANDLTANRIVVPSGNVLQGTSVYPIVRVENLGTNANACDLRFTATTSTGAEVYNQVQSVASLGSGAFSNVQFSLSWFASDTGRFTLAAITILGSDQNHFNDTLRVDVMVFADSRTNFAADSGGYVFSASNSTANPRPAFTWIEAGSGVGTLVNGSADDDFLSEVIQLPWPFTFYGALCDSFKVSTNGWLAFVDTVTENQSLSDPTFTELQMPNSEPPNYMIAPFWDDLDTLAINGRGIYTLHDGSKFVIQWNHFRRFIPPYGEMNFQIVLDSANNTVSLSYADSSHGDFVSGSPTQGSVGIEGSGIATLSPSPGRPFFGTGKDKWNQPISGKKHGVKNASKQGWLRLENNHSRLKGLDTYDALVSSTGFGAGYFFQGDKPLNVPTSGVTVTFSTSDSTLPMQFRYLGGTLTDDEKHVRVQWGTRVEIRAMGYELQKSKDPRINFTTVPNSFVAGHGTTDLPHDYSRTDSAATKGMWYYRIKQTDGQGGIRYSGLLQIDVSSGNDPVPREFVLFQNYPNPFNPTTDFRFGIADFGLVRLVVYDVLGREVAVLVNEAKQPGSYKVQWDASRFATGVYFYRLQSGSRSDVKKLLLLR